MKISLQAFDESHIDCVMSWENDPAYRDEKFYDGPYTREDIAALLENISKTNSEAKRFIIVVDNEASGICDLCEIDVEEKSAFVTILNAKTASRRSGIAFEALKQIEEKALELNLVKLYAWIENDNDASLNLFSKANYTRSSASKELIVDGVQYIHVTLMEKCLKKEL